MDDECWEEENTATNEVPLKESCNVFGNIWKQGFRAGKAIRDEKYVDIQYRERKFDNLCKFSLLAVPEYYT